MAADRGGDAVRAGDLVSSLLGGPLGKGLSASAAAARAWYAANGDRERAHTTGVWLQKSGRAGVDPVLVVAVDSGLYAGELGTNKDLYLSRLSFRGVRVSDIRFTVQRRQGSPAAAPQRPGREAPATERRERLSPVELERVRRACAGLPDGLRQSAERAMGATLLRSRTHGQ